MFKEMKWFLVRGLGLYRLLLLPLISGARSKVIHIPDIDHSTCPRHINVKSDVFAVFQKNVCTGIAHFGFLFHVHVSCSTLFMRVSGMVQSKDLIRVWPLIKVRNFLTYDLENRRAARFFILIR